MQLVPSLCLTSNPGPWCGTPEHPPRVSLRPRPPPPRQHLQAPLDKGGECKGERFFPLLRGTQKFPSCPGKARRGREGSRGRKSRWRLNHSGSSSMARRACWSSTPPLLPSSALLAFSSVLMVSFASSVRPSVPLPSSPYAKSLLFAPLDSCAAFLRREGRRGRAVDKIVEGGGHNLKDFCCSAERGAFRRRRVLPLRSLFPP